MGIGGTEKRRQWFLLLAKAERKIWISPGYGLEDRLKPIEEKLPETLLFRIQSRLLQWSRQRTDALFNVFSGK
jgi:uncharacterized protein